MQRIKSAIRRPDSNSRKVEELTEEYKRDSTVFAKFSGLKHSSNSQRPSYEQRVGPFNSKPSHNDNPDNHNKLNIRRINFDYEIYGLYPDDNLKPSAFFFKFLAMKLGHHSEKRNKNNKKTHKDNKYDDEEDESKLA
jgi:hypothetical protein